MKPLTLGLLQCNFRSAFDEEIAQVAQVAGPKSPMGPDDVRFNHELVMAQMRVAVADGAKLLLTPESYLDGWSCNKDILDRVVTTVPGPETDELGALAGQLGVWLCAAMFIREGRQVFNACVIINDSGGVQGIYRKAHETKSALESMRYDLGDDLPVFDTPWGVAGVLICHDRWYPEAARALRRRGAEMILNPVAAATMGPYHPYHEIHHCVLRAQAYLHGVFWCSCNSANHGGYSMVIAPDGSVIARAGGDQENLIIRIDPDGYSSYDFVSNVRDDLYRVEPRPATK